MAWKPGWSVMVVEIILLHLFGFAWLVKGEFFGFLNDKETEQSASRTRNRQMRTEVED